MIHSDPTGTVVTFRIGLTLKTFTKQQVETTLTDSIVIVTELPAKVSLEHPDRNY
jgi:hypothetical protein